MQTQTRGPELLLLRERCRQGRPDRHSARSSTVSKSRPRERKPPPPLPSGHGAAPRRLLPSTRRRRDQARLRLPLQWPSSSSGQGQVQPGPGARRARPGGLGSAPRLPRGHRPERSGAERGAARLGHAAAGGAPELGECPRARGAAVGRARTRGRPIASAGSRCAPHARARRPRAHLPAPATAPAPAPSPAPLGSARLGTRCTAATCDFENCGPGSRRPLIGHATANQKAGKNAVATGGS